MNEHGTLNVQRLQLVLNELNIFEREQFEHEAADFDTGGGRGGHGHRHRGGKKQAENKVEKARQQGQLGEYLQAAHLGRLH